MIIDNLRAAGVQNTVKNERLKFTRLEPYAGTWLHAIGEYEEKPGWSASAAGTACGVTIGPEHGTVGPDLIKDAAKEAVQGVGFDLLVVCGFAFDPHVSEETKRYGKLTVLPTRINPDLQMGGDAAQEDRLRQPVHGLRRAGRGYPDPTGWQDHRDDQGRGRLRPDHRRNPFQLPPTILPAGSSTPITTARASSSATPTSPARTSPTRSSSARCAPRSTKPPGARCIQPPAIPLTSRRPARSR